MLIEFIYTKILNPLHFDEILDFHNTKLDNERSDFHSKCVFCVSLL